MTLVSETTQPPSARSFRTAEERGPLHFPESADVPESLEHFKQRVFVYESLVDVVGSGFTVGSDQFVYYDAENPKEVVAPDAYVRLEAVTDKVRSWKVWERGAPEVCVEIVSESDATEAAWQTKLARYRTLGTTELVRFDAADEERPLRVWNRVDGQLIEREFGERRARSWVLDVDWVVSTLPDLPVALRIAKGGALVPTRVEAREAERQAKEAERQAKEAERQAKEIERAAREAAEARVRELEAKLARR